MAGNQSGWRTIMLKYVVSAIFLTSMCALCHEGAILSLAENVHEDLSIEVHCRTDEKTTELRGRRATLPEESSSISEDADVGTVVYTIQETGPGLRYAMGSPANDKFFIDEMTGDVTLMESLEYETSSTEELNVQITNVSDAGMKYKMYHISWWRTIYQLVRNCVYFT